MAIELFWGRTSPYSERILLALAVKEISFVGKRLNFTRNDFESPEFLTVNPRAQVPAIRDGNFVLHESIAILCYLDAMQPEPPLFGRNTHERGMIWQLIMECVYHLEPHMSRFAGNILSGNAAGKRLEIVESGQAVEQEFALLDNCLSQNAYLAGSTISGADLAVYPVVHLLNLAAWKANSEDIGSTLSSIDRFYPALSNWCDAIRSIPGFDSSMVW